MQIFGAAYMLYLAWKILPVYDSAQAVAGFTLILTVIGASGSFVWALFGSALCRLLNRYTKAANLIMALLLVYWVISLFV